MKKNVILLSLICLLFTGCSVDRLNLDKTDYIVDNVLLKGHRRQNSIFDGYSYYLPFGLKYLEKDDYNAVLGDDSNNKYYLYVDVVSYYHKINNTYKEDSDAFYSKRIDGKKGGYLEINKVDKDKYFIEAVYNYSKIEVFTKKEMLNDVLVNLCTVLSSVKYNDKVLETTIGENVLNYEEKSFNIFTTKKSGSSYLDYVEKYDSIYNGDSKIKDEDYIEIEEFD